MKKLAVSIIPLLFLCGCAETEPEVRYVDRPVVRTYHHTYQVSPPIDSDAPERFRAIEKPSTYSH